MSGPVGTEYDRDLETFNYYKFIEKLWGDDGEKFRKELKDFAPSNIGGLRACMRDHRIRLPPDADVWIIDIEGNERVQVTDARNDDWYYMILPPNPRRHPGDDQYKETQAWSEALHAAVDDSYGM